MRCSERTLARPRDPWLKDDVGEGRRVSSAQSADERVQGGILVIGAGGLLTNNPHLPLSSPSPTVGNHGLCGFLQLLSEVSCREPGECEDRRDRLSGSCADYGFFVLGRIRSRSRWTNTRYSCLLPPKKITSTRNPLRGPNAPTLTSPIPSRRVRSALAPSPRPYPSSVQQASSTNG
jgi:hypothetical protein